MATPKYYYALFRDKNNDVYKVAIITNFQSVDSEATLSVGGGLVLTETPVSIEYAGEESNLYKQYKCSTATVSMFQDMPEAEFSDASGNNVFISVMKQKQMMYILNADDFAQQSKDKTEFDVIWAGYATPNAYTQPFENQYDKFELECQDALSTLKYYDMKKYVSGGYISFTNVILRMLSKLRCIKDVYITNAVQTETGANVLTQTATELNNWFDEDNEPEKMLDVFAEILKYYNLTAVQVGDKVFIMQYDAVAADSATYAHYINKDASYSKTYFSNRETEDNCFSLANSNDTLSKLINIQPENIAPGNTSITLESVFNRCKVISSFYDYPDEITDVEKDDVNIFSNKVWVKSVVADQAALGNSISDTKFIRTYSGTNPRSGLYVYYSKYDWNNNITFIEFYNKKILGSSSVWSDEPEHEIDSPLKLYIYQNDENKNDTPNGASYWVWKPRTNKTFIKPQGSSNEWKLQSARYNAGAFVVRYYNHSFSGETDGRNWQNVLNTLDAPPLKQAIAMSGWRQGNGQIRSENYPKNERETNRQIYLKYTTPVVTLTAETMIVISGSMTFYNDEFLLPGAYGASDKIVGDDNYIYGRVKCGSQYFNGSTWQSSECDCKIYTSAKNDASAFYSSFKFQNFGVRWYQQYNGYSIAPPTGGYVGEIEVSIYRPFGFAPVNYAQLTILEDFAVSLVSESDDQYSENNDPEKTDNEFVNVMSDVAVEDYEDVEMKITTGDSRHTANYSNAILLGSTNQNLGKIKNIATNYIEIAEKQYLNNIVHQYSTPTLALEINVKYSLNILPYTRLKYHYFVDKIFVVDSCSIDVESDNLSLRLVEKKQIDSAEPEINILDKEIKKDVGRNGRLLK